mmetsp:Transcript_27038/g.71119  ORF Transcript_27038/g.71119 Transcript_27038/m.71119 type:complete len:202 (-) Transcript_27038:458-1063(-)
MTRHAISVTHAKLHVMPPKASNHLLQKWLQELVLPQEESRSNRLHLMTCFSTPLPTLLIPVTAVGLMLSVPISLETHGSPILATLCSILPLWRTSSRHLQSKDFRRVPGFGRQCCMEVARRRLHACSRSARVAARPRETGMRHSTRLTLHIRGVRSLHNVGVLHRRRRVLHERLRKNGVRRDLWISPRQDWPHPRWARSPG